MYGKLGGFVFSSSSKWNFLFPICAHCSASASALSYPVTTRFEWLNGTCWGGVLMQRSALLPHRKMVPCSVWSLHAIPVYVWVFSGCLRDEIAEPSRVYSTSHPTPVSKASNKYTVFLCLEYSCTSLCLCITLLSFWQRTCLYWLWVCVRWRECSRRLFFLIYYSLLWERSLGVNKW